MKPPGMFTLYLACAVLGYHIIFGNYNEYVTRKTLYGTIRGFVSERIPGEEVEQFLGVPFAAPPVQNLRFEVSVHICL